MSFILDALKKSESARQRDNRHDSAQIATGPGKAATSPWLILVGVLLLVNVLVLLVVFLKPAQTRSENVLTTTAKPAQAVRTAAETFREPMLDIQPDPLPPEPVHTTTTKNAAITGQRIAENLNATTAAQTSVPAVIAHTVSTGHRTFNEVRLSGGVQLPELHLDIHVYSEIAVERFVFINMNKYKENATLHEGPRVNEIVAEGVILEYRGTRFLLPRE